MSTSAAASRKVTRKAAGSRKRLGPNEILHIFSDWLGLKDSVTKLEKRKDSLRDTLKAEITAQGDPDEKGSMWLDLDEPVTAPDGKTYVALKNTKRVSQTLNEAKAEALLKAKGLTDECTNLLIRVTDHAKAVAALQKAGLLDAEGLVIDKVLDEEAILAAHYTGKLTQDEVDGIFDTKVVFAFNPVEG